VHTSSAPELSDRARDEAEQAGTMAGGILEADLSRRYVSIGTIFVRHTTASRLLANG
jgi:hypothetical protein